MLAVVTLYTFFAGWQSVSLSRQLKTAREANDLITKNFKSSQRAWVGSETVEIPTPAAEQPIVWSFVLKNFGNSPAMKVGIRDTAQLINAPRVDATTAWFLPTMLPDKTKGETLTIFNGQPYEFVGHIDFLLYPFQAEDVVQGKSVIVYYSEVTYTDIFGEVHKTHICRIWSKLGAAACGFGEDAD